jgi:putative ABC transport system permease protein
MNVWAMALRNVFRNRRRSLLTFGVVAFGFAAFALAGGFMSQTFSSLKEGTIRGGVGQLQLADEAAFEGIEEKTLEHAITDEERVASILRRDPSVDAILPRIDFLGLISNGARSVPFLGVGFDPREESRVMESKELIASGRWFSDPAESAVVLGTGLARALNLKAGDSVTLFGTTPDGVLNALDVTVAGLSDIPIKELNDRYLATTLPAASKLLGVSGRVSKIVLLLKPGNGEEAVRDRLLSELAAGGIKLAARTWRELALFYNQVKLLYLGIFGFMGAVLVIVVLLACANTMTMAAAERTREIGTLRAIGTPPALIQRMFVAEGVVIATIGCLAGAVFALVIRAALNASHVHLPPPPGATHGSEIHVAFFGATYLAGLAAMLATLAVASYIPARRASRLPIVEALSHI